MRHVFQTSGSVLLVIHNLCSSEVKINNMSFFYYSWKNDYKLDLSLERLLRDKSKKFYSSQMYYNNPPKHFHLYEELHKSMNNCLFYTRAFSKEYSAAFRSFLESEFSEENFDFWLACEDFKSTLDDLNWKAEKIYEEFIRPTACREVSLTVIQ